MEQLINTIDFISSAEWLLLTLSVFFVVNVVVVYKQRKQLMLQTMVVEALQQDLRALANAAVGVGGRVLKIERQQKNQTTNIATPSPTTKEDNHLHALNNNDEFYSTSNQPYEQAIRMAQKGVDAETIANVTGLSESESSLVCVMHRLEEAS